MRMSGTHGPQSPNGTLKKSPQLSVDHQPMKRKKLTTQGKVNKNPRIHNLTKLQLKIGSKKILKSGQRKSGTHGPQSLNGTLKKSPQLSADLQPMKRKKPTTSVSPRHKMHLQAHHRTRRKKLTMNVSLRHKMHLQAHQRTRRKKLTTSVKMP